MAEYEYYDQTASHTQAYLWQPLIKCLKVANSKVILDVGCGNGNIAGKLLSLGYDVYGIDTSESGIQLAKKHFSEQRFWVFNAESEVLPSELNQLSIDTIISTEVIEHLYSPLTYIQFCKKILQANQGTLILSTPYHGYLKNLALAVTGKLDAHFTANWEGGHIKFFSKDTLTDLLESQGFKVSRFIGAGRFPYFWKSMIISAHL